MAGKRVIPGDFLSTEEEFEPGRNAFAEAGEIFSNSVGTVQEDNRQKTVSVKADVDVSSIKPNDVVFGEVMLVKDNSVGLSIFTETSHGSRKVLVNTYASIPIRLVSRDYVKNLKDAFKIGDLVKAKVFSVKPFGTDVKTNEPELGVVKAFCSKCRKPLHLFGRQLKCLSCGSSERRKISSDYLLK